MPTTPNRLAPEKIAAMRVAQARVAPYLPPLMAQGLWIARLNGDYDPPNGKYSVPAWGVYQPDEQQDSAGGSMPGPFVPQERFGAGDFLPPQTDAMAARNATDMSTAFQNPFVPAAVAASSDADREVQPIRDDDALLSTGDLTGGIRPAPLSPPNASNAMGRMATVYPMEHQPKSSVGEPGFVESLIPLWGPGRAAINAFQNGDYVWGGVNTALFAADLAGGELLREPATAALNGLVRGYEEGSIKQGLKEELKPWWKTGSHEWGATRKQYAAQNLLPKGMPVHHWLVPQRWEDQFPWLFPKKLFNQPWNLLPMTRAPEVGTTPRFLHDAIEGKGKQNFQFDPDNAVRDYYLRFKYGTPDWAKVGIPASLMSAAGTGADVGNAIYDYLYGDDSNTQ